MVAIDLNTNTKTQKHISWNKIMNHPTWRQEHLLHYNQNLNDEQYNITDIIYQCLGRAIMHIVNTSLFLKISLYIDFGFVLST